MQFDFSPEQQQLRDMTRRFFSESDSISTTRKQLEGETGVGQPLWQGMAEIGLMGVITPETYGGTGAGYLELCVIAEEMGRGLVSSSFSSSVYLATQLIIEFGSEKQKQFYLPKLASGECIGTFALNEGATCLSTPVLKTQAVNGRIDGLKKPVPDADVADFSIVAARSASGHNVDLYLVDLKGEGVAIDTLSTIDPSRPQSVITFSNALSEPLGDAKEAWDRVVNIMDRAAVLFAFEQLGGAERAMEVARDYALTRMAFGRQVGSFQAVKHMLADIYVAVTLARANAYYGAWALSVAADELPQAAATARVSATQAFQLASTNNIQVHGGMGFTWEFDCHLFYRRSNALALSLGSLSYWKRRLVKELQNGIHC